MRLQRSVRQHELVDGRRLQVQLLLTVLVEVVVTPTLVGAILTQRRQPLGQLDPGALEALRATHDVGAFGIAATRETIGKLFEMLLSACHGRRLYTETHAVPPIAQEATLRWLAGETPISKPADQPAK